MASVIETRLSPRVETGFSAIPARKTDVVWLRNGSSYRNPQWSKAHRRFAAMYANFTQAQRDELLNVWHACEGMVYGFLFRDWSDYKVTGQSLGNAPSGTTAVQLVKTYTFGTGLTARTHTRTITRPESATLTVYQNGVAKAGTVDAVTGLFTPSTSWTEGQALTADFHFLIPVIFASDEPEWIVPFRDMSEVRVELLELVNE